MPRGKRKKPFIVNLIFEVKADDPVGATEEVFSLLTMYGLRNWAYEVVDPATGTEFLVNDGKVRDPKELLAETRELEGLDDEEGEEGETPEDIIEVETDPEAST